MVGRLGFKMQLPCEVFSDGNCNHMKKKCLSHTDCPVARGYNAIGDWWSLLIVSQILHFRQRRFGQMQQDLGMAKNILTARLAKLLEEDIIEKVPAPEGGPHHHYIATPRGRDLFPIVVALRQWGEKHYFTCDEAKHQLVDREHGRPIPELKVRAADGCILGPDDVRFAEPCAAQPVANTFPSHPARAR